MFWVFGREACGILAPQPGIEPTPPALEGEVLTTGLFSLFKNKISYMNLFFYHSTPLKLICRKSYFGIFLSPILPKTVLYDK